MRHVEEIQSDKWQEMWNNNTVLIQSLARNYINLMKNRGVFQSLVPIFPSPKVSSLAAVFPEH